MAESRVMAENRVAAKGRVVAKTGTNRCTAGGMA